MYSHKEKGVQHSKAARKFLPDHILFPVFSVNALSCWSMPEPFFITNLCFKLQLYISLQSVIEISIQSREGNACKVAIRACSSTKLENTVLQGYSHYFISPTCYFPSQIQDSPASLTPDAFSLSLQLTFFVLTKQISENAIPLQKSAC